MFYFIYLSQDMKTKDRILKEALVLFNQQGSDDVSLRAIARSMDISVGNLAYHYANTDRIIEALYLELAEKWISRLKKWKNRIQNFL